MITERIGKVFFALGYGYLAIFLFYTLFTNTIKPPVPSDVVPVFPLLYYIFLALIVAVCYFSRNLINFLVEKHFKFLRIILFVFAVLVLLAMAWGNFRNVGGSDAWNNDNAAITYVQTGQLSQKQSEYYMYFATNYPLLFFNIILAKITHATSANDITYLSLHMFFHIAAMLAAIFVAFLIAKRFLQKKGQLCFILLEILFLSIDFRIHDGYNDSFLIAFPVFLFYLFIKFIESQKAVSKILFLLAYSIIFAICFTIRPTILILEVIIIVSYFFCAKDIEIRAFIKEKILFSRFLNTLIVLVMTLLFFQVPTTIRTNFVSSHPGLQYRAPVDEICQKYSSEEECQKMVEGYVKLAQINAGVQAAGNDSAENKQGSTFGALVKLGISFKRLAEGKPSPDLKTRNPFVYFVKVNKYLLQDPSFHILGEPIFTPTQVNSDPLAKFVQTYFSPKTHVDLWTEAKITTLEQSWKKQRVFIFYNFLVAVWAILFVVLLLFFFQFQKLQGLKKFVFVSSVVSFASLLFATAFMEINMRYLWFFLPLLLIAFAIAGQNIFPKACSVLNRIELKAKKQLQKESSKSGKK